MHRVSINGEAGSAVAIVPDRHLSLAIGKEGQNARLAAKLAGWKVDIKSDLDVDLSKMPPAPEPELDSEAQVDNDGRLDNQQLVEELAKLLEASKEAITEPVSAETKEAIKDRPESKSDNIQNDEEESILAAMIAQEEEVTSGEAQEELPTEEGLSAEEELLLLEEEEEEEEEVNSGSDISDVPEDIWSIHRAGISGNQSGGMIRFAEDIEDLRGGVTARRSRKSPAQSNGRSRRNKSPRRRR